MPVYSYDHIHLRTRDPMATALLRAADECSIADTRTHGTI